VEWCLRFDLPQLKYHHKTIESFGMGVDEAVWASVRRAHEDTTEPAAQFCRRLGVCVSTYYGRRTREGWSERPLNTEQAPKSAGRKKRVSPKQLTKRLYAAIDQELQQLEAGDDTGRTPVAASVADIERRTRTLMNMIRGFEKVLELDTDKQKLKGGRPKRRAGQRVKRIQSDVSADDAQRMRQDIAERLERLHAQWSDTTGPGDTES